MLSESEIQNCKKIFLDETHCYDEAEKVFVDKTHCYDEAEKVFVEVIEKSRNFDFSEYQDKEEAIDKLFEKGEMPAEFVAFIKDNFVNDPALSSEERFKKGLLLGKELLYHIKQRSTKVRCCNSGKRQKES